MKEISDANKKDQPSTWHDEKVSVMEQILKAKADQHEDVRDALKRTGGREIIENSPADSFWGDRTQKKWSKEENNLFSELYKKGVKTSELANNFGRKPGAIRSRLKKLLEVDSI